MLRETIRDFTTDNFRMLLSENPEEIINMFQKLAKRELTVSETGVARKTLYTWKDHDLLPYKFEDGWSRFSFIETVWLRIVSELRNIGIPIKKIQALKNTFFDKNFNRTLFDYPIDSSVELEQTYAKSMEGFIDPVTKKINLPDNAISILEEIQLSKFSFMLYGVIMQRANLTLLMDNNDQTLAYDLNLVLTDPLENLQPLIDYMSNNTVLTVNIRKIIMDVSDSHYFFKQDLKINQLISENSILQLKNLFLDNNISEITIRVTEKGRPMVHVKKQMQIEELQKEVHALKKKGTFQDLIVKTRNGNVLYFEKTELIQL